MRLHQITIENITSLRGIHTIDFDSIGKVDDLFAITGPTGSGKSSILSSMMLALYGTLPKADLKQSDLISLGEKKAKVELLFSISGKKIRALWEAKARGSTFSYDRRFFDEKGDTLPKEILPLSFDQFCKTIILNQGEFAKFLTSSFAERKDILEKLYGEKLLAKLSPFLNALLKKKQDEYAVLAEQEKNLLPYTEEEIELWTNETHDLKAKLQEYRQAQECLKTLIADLKDLFRYEQKKKELVQKNLTHQEELKVITDVYNKDQENLRDFSEVLLKNEQELQKKRPKLLGLIEKEKERDLLFKSHENNQALLKKTEEKLKHSTLLLKTIEQECLKKKAELKVLKETIPQEINTDLKVQKRLLEEAQTIFQDLSNITTKIKSEEDFTSKTIEKEKALIVELEKNEKNIAELYSTIQSSPRAEELRKIGDRLKIAHKEREEANKKYLSLEKQLSDLENFLKEQQEYFQKLDSSDQDSVDNKAQYGKLIEEIKEYLKKLAQNEGQCPICEQEVQKTLAPFQLDLAPIVKKGLFLQEELLHIAKEKSKTEEKIKQHQENKKDLEEEKSRLQKLILSESNHQNELSKLELQIQKAEETQRIHLSLKERQAFFTAEISKIRKEIDKHQIDIKYLHNLKEEKEKALSVLINESGISKDGDFSLLMSSWNKIVSGLIQTFNNEEILKEKRSHLEQVKASIEGLNNDQQQHLGQISESGLKLKKLSDLLDQEIPQGQTASTLLKAEEWKLNEARQKKESLQAKAQKTEQIKQGLEIQIKTNDEHKTEVILLMNKIWAKLKDEFQQAHQILTELPEKITTPETPDQIEDWSVLNIFLETNLEKNLEDLIFKVDEKKQIIESHKAKIDLYQAKKVKQKELQGEINSKKKELERWSNLHSLIGNDDFRNFTLGLIEKELVIFANQELQNLCSGRFALEQTEVKKGNDFSVIDRWKGGELRKVSTLSGGETFLVSLALAMALAEMSRGTASIDSFFIDEGFGTLDQDSLTEVLEALGNLKGRGKVVGIISHVKELTERIAVNITVRKNTSGESSVEINYN